MLFFPKISSKYDYIYQKLLEKSLKISSKIEANQISTEPKDRHSKLGFFAQSFHQEIQNKFSDKFINHLMPTLTNRENSVINYLSRGMTNDQVADKLNISFGTVRTHINNILHKLNAHNVTHACAIALQSKIIR